MGKILRPVARLLYGGSVKKSLSIKFISRTGVMTALVYVATITGIHIPALGFFNMSDSMIILASFLFGPIQGMIAGAFGAFFGDLTVYPIAAPYTLLIKGIEGLIFGLGFKFAKKRGILPGIKVVIEISTILLGLAVMVAGYFLSKWLGYGGILRSALTSMYKNVFQGIVSLILACVLIYQKNFISRISSTL